MGSIGGAQGARRPWNGGGGERGQRAWEREVGGRGESDEEGGKKRNEKSDMWAHYQVIGIEDEI